LSPNAVPATPRWRSLLSAVLFLLAWAFLDLVMNLRYPGRVEEPAAWYLLPSVDVTVLFCAFALSAARGWRIPNRVTALLALMMTAIRVFRIADGLVQQNYYRSVNLSLDLPLVPDLARLMRTTVPLPRLLLGGLLAVAALAGTTALVGAALRHAQRFLATGRDRALFTGMVAGTLLLSPLWPAGRSSELHAGLFGKSVLPVLAGQVRAAVSAAELRRAKAAEIRSMQERLRATPSNLERLRGADLLLFLVESYGSTLLHDPVFRARMQPAYEAFQAALDRRGLLVASGWLDSSTYGGGSWLAHATLATGVRIGDGLEYALVRQMAPPPRTMAAVFADAGYRTVLVQPGTTRPWPEGMVHGFQHKYYAPELAYRGPAFGWATMPDQYVLDFIHRRELAPASGPLFIEYALVSSHAPWSVQPPLVDDWEALGDGRRFHDLSARKFDVPWNHLDQGGEAYVESVRYDLAVLERYLTRRVTRDALVIILGDHQPSGAVSGDDPSRAVPVHVITRDPALLERFTGIGYARGMRPTGAGGPGMERFLPLLLERLSGQR
jgi:hypothetical protein